MSEEQVFEFMLKTVHMNTAEIIRKRGLESGGKVQQFIDSEVLRRCTYSLRIKLEKTHVWRSLRPLT